MNKEEGKCMNEKDFILFSMQVIRDKFWCTKIFSEQWTKITQSKGRTFSVLGDVLLHTT